jgi:hypothetical protein
MPFLQVVEDRSEAKTKARNHFKIAPSILVFSQQFLKNEQLTQP